MQTRTWDELWTQVEALCGVSEFATSEEAQVTALINRRLYDAYRRSDLWPRYLVLGEARAASSSVIPFTQATLNTIDTFLRVYDTAPYSQSSPREYSFNVTADGAKVAVNNTSASTFYVDYKKVWNGPFNSTTNSAIPQEMFQYAAHGAYADFLRYDKQQDKAALADAEAEQLLLVELSNPMLQRTASLAGKRLRTHQTTQSR